MDIQTKATESDNNTPLENNEQSSPIKIDLDESEKPVIILDSKLGDEDIELELTPSQNIKKIYHFNEIADLNRKVSDGLDLKKAPELPPKEPREYVEKTVPKTELNKMVGQTMTKLLQLTQDPTTIMKEGGFGVEATTSRRWKELTDIHGGGIMDDSRNFAFFEEVKRPPGSKRRFKHKTHYKASPAAADKFRETGNMN